MKHSYLNSDQIGKQIFISIFWLVSFGLEAILCCIASLNHAQAFSNQSTRWTHKCRFKALRHQFLVCHYCLPVMILMLYGLCPVSSVDIFYRLEQYSKSFPLYCLALLFPFMCLVASKYYCQSPYLNILYFLYFPY